MSTLMALVAVACLIGCFIGLAVIGYTIALTTLKTVGDFINKTKQKDWQMRCKACNVILNDYELSRKEKETDLFLDLCGKCLTISNEAAHNVVIDADDLDINETIGDSPWLKN